MLCLAAQQGSTQSFCHGDHSQWVPQHQLFTDTIVLYMLYVITLCRNDAIHVIFVVQQAADLDQGRRLHQQRPKQLVQQLLRHQSRPKQRRCLGMSRRPYKKWSKKRPLSWHLNRHRRQHRVACKSQRKLGKLAKQRSRKHRSLASQLKEASQLNRGVLAN